jgi:pyruvate/2-oxoglutarate dehydrogenase complex dihydrolipoamide dehydrogenase (E3) component
VVVIGAGAAGLEAARVAAARGHAVTVLEAASRPGGQILLTAALRRRREIMGIVEWRMAECARDGVEFRFDTLADAAEVRALAPDIVVIATGGMPNTSFLDHGEDLVTTSWDLLAGQAKPAENVLLFDDNGAHPGMTAAEFLCEAGARLEVVTPERTLAPDVGGTNYPVYFKALAKAGARVTINLRLKAVHRQGNRLTARLWDEYGRTWQERTVDQVVVEHGTLPNADLYFELKDGSQNRGEVDYTAWVAGTHRELVTNPAGTYQLYRIGDAVASRNIHAAVYDGLRLAKDL